MLKNLKDDVFLEVLKKHYFNQNHQICPRNKNQHLTTTYSYSIFRNGRKIGTLGKGHKEVHFDFKTVEQITRLP